MLNIVEFAKKLEKIDDKSIDKKKLLNRFIEEKARSSLIPLRGIFELTPYCNLDCKMCYINLNNSISQGNFRSLLPIDTWKRIINEAHDLGMIKVTLTGGECLTYPFFDQLYLLLQELHIEVGILTNGVLVDEKMSLFNDFPPKFIQISLYGSSDSGYEIVTGHRAFGRVLKNIALLKNSEIPVSLTITPSKYMEDDLAKTIELAESLNIPYNINSTLISPRPNAIGNKYNLSLDQYVELYKTQCRLRGTVLKPRNLKSLPAPGGSENDVIKKGLRCSAGRSSFTVQYNGKMSLCSSLYDVGTNILDLKFKDAWNELNKLAKEYVVPIECNGCPYETICLVCPAAHRESVVLGHCDPKICAQTQRFVQEGIMQIPEKDITP